MEREREKKKNEFLVCVSEGMKVHVGVRVRRFDFPCRRSSGSSLQYRCVVVL